MHADFDDSDNAEELARCLSDQKGEPIRYKRIEPGEEHILPPREQRELDAVPSRLDPGA